MTTAVAAKNTPGVVRTPRHLYYFNGAGPWPGVTTVTDVLDKPALTKWHREQVAQAAIAAAERLIADRESGNVEAAIAEHPAVYDVVVTGRPSTRSSTTLAAENARRDAPPCIATASITSLSFCSR